jgi:2,4-dienoyl-CoA reductase-like NADH-dependent reductase (Old Yellow Enzyme family)
MLFEPITIKGVTARNRVVVSPMCQYQSREGSPTDWHFVHLGRYAVGGAGIVFYEETAVEERGRKTHHCAGIYRDGHVAEFRRLTDLIRALGAVPAMQLGHSGGKASAKGPLENRESLKGSEAWRAISASTTPPTPNLPPPRAMSHDDIREVVRNWGIATQRTIDAGFDVLEIHGAHGYLIQQFLSPVTNHRNDAYGGDIEGRMRFALEVTEEVRRVWPNDKPLFFRVSSVDGEGGLWSLAETVTLSAALKERGVDLIDCSSGGILGTSAMRPVPRVPGYHIPYAKSVKEKTGIMTMAAGLITEAKQAEDLLQSGVVDLIGMARELMYNSDWPVHAAKELGVANYIEMFPPGFVHRFKGLERARAMEINHPDKAQWPT